MIDNLHQPKSIKEITFQANFKIWNWHKEKKVMIVENMNNAFKVIGLKHIVNYLLLLVIVYWLINYLLHYKTSNIMHGNQGHDVFQWPKQF
jgi:hypothetical protein